MENHDDLMPGMAIYRETMAGMWQWLALRRIAASPCHGYELIRYFARLGWSGAPAASALYPYLGKFLAEGFLSVSQRGRRKVYAITSSGEEHLRATADPNFERIFEASQNRGIDQVDPDFSEAAAHVTAAIELLKQRGNAKDLKAAARVLSKAAEALG